MAGKKKPPARPAPALIGPEYTTLSKLSLLVGDIIETETGQRFVYTADLRGSRWGREVHHGELRGLHGPLQELPDVPYRLVRSPNSERKEEKEAVVDPMTETRRP